MPCLPPKGSEASQPNLIMKELNALKIGFIGFGNMAQAIAKGLIGQKVVRPEQLYACAKHWDKLCENTGALGMHAEKSAAEVADAVDIVFVAVKPYMIHQVLTPVRDILHKKVVVSVAAGYPFEKYEEVLLSGTHHLSTIPNTPVSIGEGIFVCENRHSLTPEEYETVHKLLSGISLVIPVETAQLSIAGTICGCGPAFVAMFMEAMADAAVMHGIPRAAAYEMVSQMTAGTGKLQLASGAHPAAMKDAVCSPNGTTIVGVAALERKGLRSAVIDAVDAIERK